MRQQQQVQFGEKRKKERQLELRDLSSSGTGSICVIPLRSTTYEIA
jgi:hypothetical protein